MCPAESCSRRARMPPGMLAGVGLESVSRRPRIAGQNHCQRGYVLACCEPGNVGEYSAEILPDDSWLILVGSVRGSVFPLEKRKFAGIFLTSFRWSRQPTVPGGISYPPWWGSWTLPPLPLLHILGGELGRRGVVGRARPGAGRSTGAPTVRADTVRADRESSAPSSARTARATPYCGLPHSIKITIAGRRILGPP